MPRLTKPDLLQIAASAIIECGWNVLYIDDQHPFRLQVYNAEKSFRVKVYIWNITHGGGKARPKDEYRIQITGISQFSPEPDGKTLILGWWNEAGIFAGFDFDKHRGNLGASPSLQIREDYLRRAYIDGFSACPKGNDEIAIAFRPAFILEYITNLEALHDFGASPAGLAALQTVAETPNVINDSALQALTHDRKIVVKSVQQRLRNTSFRSRVLAAYSYRCAFCGLQLDLVQAAHILPVSHDSSTDDTHNGVAACFLHHAAYDRALVTFDEHYLIHLDEAKMRRFVEINHHGGMEEFRNVIRPLIILPPAIFDRPHVDSVKLSNQIRGWDL